MIAALTNTATNSDTEYKSRLAHHAGNFFVRLSSPNKTKYSYVGCLPSAMQRQVRLDSASSVFNWENEYSNVYMLQNDGDCKPLQVVQQIMPNWHVVCSETSEQEDNQQAKQAVENTLLRAEDEEFEDGIGNSLSKRIDRLVYSQGIAAINALDLLSRSRSLRAEVIGEVLKLIGMSDHSDTYLHRRSLLERSLQSDSAFIRDGAALGLSFMDDPHALTYLRDAVEREAVSELRDDLQQVVSQLEQTSQCLIS